MKRITSITAVVLMVLATGCETKIQLLGITTYRNGVMSTVNTTQRTENGSNRTDTTTTAPDATNAADKKYRAAAAVTGSGSAKAVEGGTDE